ncbi:hypothetical protein PBI_SCTP2_481 [Salicola phage SCTP-2]|nr:hypothetical protein PBI_SCTP2_481 [Salicola phage SCTP-2]
MGKIRDIELNRFPYKILEIENPSTHQWYLALCKEPYLLEYNQNPSFVLLERMCKEKPHIMIRDYHHLLSEDQKMTAIYHNPVMISAIDNPDEKIQLYAVMLSSYAITGIKNPSEKILLQAVKHWPDSILRIKNRNITKEMILIALEKRWDKNFLDRIEKKLRLKHIPKDHWFKYELKKLKVKNGPMSDNHVYYIKYKNGGGIDT